MPGCWFYWWEPHFYTFNCWFVKIFCVGVVDPGKWCYHLVFNPTRVGSFTKSGCSSTFLLCLYCLCLPSDVSLLRVENGRFLIQINVLGRHRVVSCPWVGFPSRSFLSLLFRAEVDKSRIRGSLCA